MARLLLALPLLLLLGACDEPRPEVDGGASVRDAGSTGCEGSGCLFDPFALLADPYLPARTLPGITLLASSREPEPAEGFGNDDFGNYESVEADGSRVLLSADGPGLITRIWFTGRQPEGQLYEVMDRLVMHVEVDGEEAVFTPGGSGVTLLELTSGELPSFPRPWVAGRDTASNAFLVHVPIAFSSSIRIWIEEPPGIDTLVYYQVDWRQLPADLSVEPFDGTLSAGQIASLERATELWVERSALAPIESRSEEVVIAPGESASVALSEPTTVRALRAELLMGSLADLEGELIVDGESAIDAPLLRWGFATPPTTPHDSALSTIEEAGPTFRYPFPVHEGMELLLRNVGAGAVEARVVVEHDPGPPEPGLGALRAACGEERSPAEGQNLRLLDVTGARGHYAGQFLIIEASESSFWVLEGDHEMFADGEAILGTGLEDYFGGSFYYLAGTFTLPLAGASYRSRAADMRLPIVSQYRHHFLDSVSFERDFRFEYESFLPDSRFEHCAFWYRSP